MDGARLFPAHLLERSRPRRPLRWPRTAGDFCSRSAGPFPERARNLTCANLSARTTLSSSARRPSSATDPRQLLRFSRSHRSFFSGLFRTSPSAETSSAAASAPRTSIESTSKKRLLRTSQRQRATDRNRPKRVCRRQGFASKELIQKAIRSGQSDGPQYTQC